MDSKENVIAVNHIHIQRARRVLKQLQPTGCLPSLASDTCYDYSYDYEAGVGYTVMHYHTISSNTACIHGMVLDSLL